MEHKNEKVRSEEIIKRIKKYKYISFDIFDTLIKRNCLQPKDIFSICEKIYNRSNNTHINSFESKRIDAEITARKLSNYEEVTLEEIYRYLDVSDLNKELMMKIEKETELKYCTQNKEMYEVYKYCVEKNKKIYFTSDMYLDKEIITTILRNNGYKIGKLFLSSDLKANKVTGNLFKKLCNDEKIKFRDLIHIGNSKKADFIIPTLLGIKSIKIRTYYNNTTYIKKEGIRQLDDNIIFSFINNNEYGLDEYEKIGYELLGPISYAFSCWLHKKAKKNGDTKLLFCARDMYFIERVYNIIWKNEAIENKYFYISRKSVRKPYYYKQNSFEDFCKIIPPKKVVYFEELLKNNGVEINSTLKEKIKKYNLEEKKYDNKTIIEDKNARKFYDEHIKEKIKSESKKQYEYFINYLDELQFNKGTALVDLGWNGTIQMSMQKILDHEINSYYFGIDNGAHAEISSNNAYGFLFNKNENSELESKIYSFRTLFEILFQALHGTTLEYDSGKIKYKLGIPDNLNSEVVKKIQDYAIKFAEDFEKTDLKFVDSVFPMYSLLELGTNPTLNQSKIFGNLNFDNITTGKLAKPQNIIFYIFHLRTFKRDFSKSQWKIGFLKRMLKINLPYYELYRKSREKKYKEN